MARALQKRTLETRSRLTEAAEAIINEVGFSALRVEEVVLRAGTAKGTFFAHFKDKDSLMDLIIGQRIDMILDELEKKPAPETTQEFAANLQPLTDFMTCERYVFDVILRYSGAAGVEEIGPIATTFGRQLAIFEMWFANATFRRDVSAQLLAEGIQAFLFQAMASHFCALHNAQTLQERLQIYLKAWLTPNMTADGKTFAK